MTFIYKRCIYIVVGLREWPMWVSPTLPFARRRLPMKGARPWRQSPRVEDFPKVLKLCCAESG